MAPLALGKRPRSTWGQGSGETCVHGKGWRGYLCKECPGKGICEHGRQRSQCKECGGSGICEHGRRRYRCKECREARASSARVIRLPFRLKPETKVIPEIKQEPSDTSDPGVEPDAEVEPEIKSEPSDASDPGSVEP